MIISLLTMLLCILRCPGSPLETSWLWVVVELSLTLYHNLRFADQITNINKPYSQCSVSYISCISACMYIYLATRQKRLVLKIVTSFLALHAGCYITRNVFTVSTTEYGMNKYCINTRFLSYQIKSSKVDFLMLQF